MAEEQENICHPQIRNSVIEYIVGFWHPFHEGRQQYSRETGSCSIYTTRTSVKVAGGTELDRKRKSSSKADILLAVQKLHVQRQILVLYPRKQATKHIWPCTLLQHQNKNSSK